MGIGTENRQFDLGYDHKFMIKIGVYLTQEIQWNILL